MYPIPQKSRAPRNVTRRNFLRLFGIASASLLVTNCGPRSLPIVSLPSPSISKTPVAIVRAQTYDRATLEKQLQILIDQLGGLSDVVKPGDSVAIKPNLTGGVYSGRLSGISAEESFVTHPEVVRALVKQVQAAGAKEVFIVESVYEWESYTQWGYEQIANDLGVKLIDLNDSKPYADFVETSVGPNSYIYKSFTFNSILKDIDVFMSVSKMKNHYLAGITHTLKNLYGLVPYRYYRLNDQDKYRSAFHGADSETRERLPRIIVDINRARPIHFSLIDGVKTIQGGEGPWISSVATIEPGVLIAGKNPVATDAVATAIMGHEPTEDYPNPPFVRCINHLNLAAQAGLGTNRLDEIEVLGMQVKDAKIKFAPAP